MRTSGIRPNLNLEKITGIRPDKIILKNTVNFKQENIFPTPIKAIKYKTNETRDGMKF